MTRHPIFVVATSGIILLLTMIIIGFFMYTQSLASRVGSLQESAALAKAHMAAFEKVRCKSEASITTSNTLTRYTIQAAGYTRTYQVHTPISYDAQLRYPIIISFDGIDGSGDRIEGYSELDTLPVITVYPDSLPGKQGFTAWQGAPYSLDGDYDISFVKEVLNDIPTRYCADSTQTYAVGMSNGGSFAMLVGCTFGNQIKAVASVSGAYYSTCQQQQRTPSLLVLHSTEDQQVPFAGVPSRHLPEISAWVERQAVDRTCKAASAPQIDGQLTARTWSGCKNGSVMRFVVIQDQPHGWLQVPSVYPSIQNTAGYIWNFFEALPQV